MLHGQLAERRLDLIGRGIERDIESLIVSHEKKKRNEESDEDDGVGDFVSGDQPMRVLDSKAAERQ
jgi:hypothetical protein